MRSEPGRLDSDSSGAPRKPRCKLAASKVPSCIRIHPGAGIDPIVMGVEPNDLISGYTFVRTLGEGPAGVVWLARERDSAVPVTIKLLKPEVFPPSAAQNVYERLVASVTSAGRLTHANLARVRTTFHEPRMGLRGLVSEYVEGQTLEHLQVPRKRDGRPGLSDPATLAGVLLWFQQLAAVLAWLHKQKLVHGNVKPSNVMLIAGRDRPSVKLLDLCWSLADIEGESRDDTFLPPERRAGREPQPASDQWTVAKLLDELVRRRTEPASDGGYGELTIPPELSRVIGRGLEDAPIRRYPDIGAFFYALESVRHALEADAERERSENGSGFSSRIGMAGAPAERDLATKTEVEIERAPRNARAMAGAGLLIAAILILVVTRFFAGNRISPGDVDSSGAVVPVPGMAQSRSLGAPPKAQPASTAPVPTQVPESGAPPLPLAPDPRASDPRSSENDAACLRGDSRACVEVAERHLEPRGAARDPRLAVEAFARACDLGRLEGCVRGAEILANDAAARDGKRARRLYEKACDRRHAAACAALSRLYGAGIGGAPNARAAEAFRRRACGLGLREACG